MRKFGAANSITLIATMAACIAAGAALLQASISRDTEFRQLRAYLYVSHGALNQTLNSAGADISIKHSGATPAYNVRIDVVALVGTYLLNSNDLSDPTQRGGAIHKQIAILNSSDQFSVPVAVSYPDALRLLNNTDKTFGEHALYIHGVVRYHDVFSLEASQPERKYEFCFVFRPIADAPGTERGCEKHNNPG
jgi:hypothetical protein